MHDPIGRDRCWDCEAPKDCQIRRLEHPRRWHSAHQSPNESSMSSTIA